MVSILSKDFVWTPAVKTNIVNTWRKHGWTPPSEQLEYVNKWKSFKDNNHETDSLSTGQSTEIVRASTQDQR